jgi:hypothetical protein
MANCNIRNIPDRAHFMIKNLGADIDSRKNYGADIDSRKKLFMSDG